MSAKSKLLSLTLVLSFTLNAAAANRYVDINSATPSWPYGDWSSAATTIQDAIDAAADGDLILVTNGIYQTGTRVVTGSLENRVVVNKVVTLQSVNGPGLTTIQGYQLPGMTNGDGAVRCVYLTNNAALIGFTLANGATRGAGASAAERSGGGVYAFSSSIVSNCVIIGNAAATQGGGAYRGILRDCVLFGNSATNGGGAYSSALSNCALSNNTAIALGGGVNAASLSNCVLNLNSATNGGGAYASTLTNCVLFGNVAITAGGGAHGGILNGCLIRSNTATDGGGAYASAVVNCTFDRNRAVGGGGGIRGGTLVNSTLTRNLALYGGGSYYTSATNCLFNWNSAGNSGGGALGDSWTAAQILVNCTFVGNSALIEGGGVWGCRLTNCIVYFNTAAVDENAAYSRAYHSATTPDVWGEGNLLADPQMASASHLSAVSPCRGAGFSNAAKGTDIDSETWLSPPSMGCDEFRIGAVTGAVSVAIQSVYSAVATGTPLRLEADIIGRLTASRWEFHDGLIISNQPCMTRQWPTTGNFPVVLRAYNESFPAGISATTTVQVISRPVHYVRVDSTTPAPPYSSWNTAANTIQDAVDAVAVPGSLVLVSNGVYAIGGRVAAAALTNRLTVSKPMEVRSVNGAPTTVIQGYQIPGTGYGDAAVRCAFLVAGSHLSGFTLTGGATRQVPGGGGSGQGGGGIFAAAKASVSDCVISNNLTTSAGGGVFGGILTGCLVVSNAYSWGANGGGCYRSSLSNCVIIGNRGSDGGGAWGSTLNNCVVSGNNAAWGGGIHGGSARNCLLTGNSAGTEGAGAYSATLINCTVVSNAANVNGYGGGGFSQCAVTNSIIYYNTGPTTGWGENYGGYGANNFLDHCCTTPLPAGGADNFTNPPSFVNPAMGNWRLLSTSPAINSGRRNGTLSEPDLDGLPRVTGGTVDLGAYEFQTPASTLSYAWAYYYGLPVNGSADYADTDGDGLNNWRECIAGTNPTNALSLLKLSSISNGNPGLKVAWQSTPSRTYFLERAVNLAASPAFLMLATNINGQAGTTTFTDSTATNPGPYFYRVGVEE